MSYVGKVKDTAGNTHLVGSTLYGTCSTAAGTAAKVVTCANFDKLEEGVTIHVFFSASNTAANPTLNVNGTGAIAIGTGFANGALLKPGTTTDTSWVPGAVVSFTYAKLTSSTYAWMLNDYIANTDNNTKNTAGSTNSTSKLFLVGATSQAANPQTYSNSKVYATNGALVADSYNGIALAQGNAGSFTITNTGASGGVLTVPPGPTTLAAAAAKDVDTSIASGSTSTNLPTTKAVADYVDGAVSTATSGALSYHGVATALTDITDTNYKKGWYWMVGTNPSITIDGVTCEAGDMIIAQQNKTATADNDLDVVQANIEALTTAEIDALWAAA